METCPILYLQKHVVQSIKSAETAPKMLKNHNF